MADDTEEHVTTTEARGAVNASESRHALFIGTGLVILLFAIILFIAG